MLICGVDPGLARLGYALVEESAGSVAVRCYGCLETPKDLAITDRLFHLYGRLKEIFAWKPDVLALEAFFFNKNKRTALVVAEARGVVLLAAAERGLPVVEYAPPQIKQAIVGYGGAEKRQVQEMLRLTLNLPGLPRPDDAADALAVAVCHAQVARYERRARLGGDGPV